MAQDHVTVRFTDELWMDIPMFEARFIIQGLGIDPKTVPVEGYAEIIKFGFEEFVATTAGEVEQRIKEDAQ